MDISTARLSSFNEEEKWSRLGEPVDREGKRTNRSERKIPSPRKFKKPRLSDTMSVMNRNHFQDISVLLPSSQWENYRIYPHKDIGYSANARIFKQQTDQLEDMVLVLNCHVFCTDEKGELHASGAEALGVHSQVTQCADCSSYFELKNYFRAFPAAKGRVLHVRNTKIIRVQNSSFKVPSRIMCASVHHGNRPFILFWSLMDPKTSQIVLVGHVPIVAKQWKRSTEPPPKEVIVSLFETPLR